ncbi:MAG TPA: riboflavin synthase [Candidatus Sulfotelmatobacter sp.]|jgi:riboflavin synthase|nr:riboflavin synthase [Candidatus Sulfotelmatobacter sp.]
MFTGIITHLGTVKKKTDVLLSITTDKELLKQLTNGTSIAINGICLTVVSRDNDSFSINYMPETAKKTNIQYLQPAYKVNLELPATTNTLLSGHIVQGHIDSIGKITSIEKKGNSLMFTFIIPKSLNKYIVEKGSISVNGISLTVVSVTEGQFSVGIIPHTWEKTMLHTTKVGDYINVEVDVLAKYLEKLIKSK